MEKLPKTFRRLSRHELVYSVNDLLGIDLDLRDELPEDRGTYKFDTHHQIELTETHLKNYFNVIDSLLESAFPGEGFPQEKTWQLKMRRVCLNLT